MPVYTNDTWALGGNSGGHIQAVYQTYNYSGHSKNQPICFSLVNETNGCFTVSNITHENELPAAIGGVAVGLTQWSMSLWYPMNRSYEAANADGPNIPDCEADGRNHTKQPPWRRCRSSIGTSIGSVGGLTLDDWSNRNSTHGRDISEGYWKVNHGPVQSQLWRLTAVMGGLVTVLNNLAKPESSRSERWDRVIQACVPVPYAILLGKLTIEYVNDTWSIECERCQLTNCLYKMPEFATQMMLLHQPSFVMLPVNVSHPWYNDRGLQTVKLATELLLRGKRFIGLLIAGVIALVTVIAGTIAAAVSLSQSVHTAHYVNELSANVTQALGVQETIDVQVNDRLNALYDTVTLIGRELQSLKLRLDLDCHVEFKHICVTNKTYNNTEYSWGRIEKHLKGVWNDGNMSLDLRELHSDIISLRESPKLDVSAASMAKDLVQALQHAFPTFGNLSHQLYGIVGLAVLILLGIVCAPMILKIVFSTLNQVQTRIHELNLRTRPERLEPYKTI